MYMRSVHTLMTLSMCIAGCCRVHINANIGVGGRFGGGGGGCSAARCRDAQPRPQVAAGPRQTWPPVQQAGAHFWWGGGLHSLSGSAPSPPRRQHLDTRWPFAGLTGAFDTALHINLSDIKGRNFHLDHGPAWLLALLPDQI